MAQHNFNIGGRCIYCGVRRRLFNGDCMVRPRTSVSDDGSHASIHMVGMSDTPTSDGNCTSSSSGSSSGGGGGSSDGGGASSE